MTSGSRVRFVWRPHPNLPTQEDLKSEFSYIYSQPSVYRIVLVVENSLGSVTANYTIRVQDPITGELLVASAGSGVVC